MRTLLALAFLFPFVSAAVAADKTPVAAVEVGSVYRIALKPVRQGLWSSSRTTYEGTVEAVSDRDLTLRVTWIEGRHDFDPVVSSIPFVGRMFKSSGAAASRTDETVTIAADRVERVSPPQHGGPSDGAHTQAAAE